MAGTDIHELPIVDAHHHFFNLGRVRYPWLTDRPEDDFLLGDYEALKRDYLPADYARDAAGFNIVAQVHVEAEADHENPLAETAWLSELNRSAGVPHAIVGHAWLHRRSSEAVIAAQAASPLVRGIRSKPITAPNAGAGLSRWAGTMDDPNWRRGLTLLVKYDLSWDLRVPFWHLEEAAAVMAASPNLRAVVNHTGLAWDRGEDGLAHWRRGMVKLAALDNVWLKVSELGLKSAPWDYDDNRRVVRQAIELFGFDRCMFASNFPVAGLRIGYAEQIEAIDRMVADASEDERRWLFAGTAREFYRLGDDTGT